MLSGIKELYMLCNNDILNKLNLSKLHLCIKHYLLFSEGGQTLLLGIIKHSKFSLKLEIFSLSIILFVFTKLI